MLLVVVSFVLAASSAVFLVLLPLQAPRLESCGRADDDADEALAGEEALATAVPAAEE